MNANRVDIITSTVDVDDNAVHYLPGADGMAAEAATDTGMLAPKMILSLTFAVCTGVPTSIALWLEFRTGDDDNFGITRQRVPIQFTDDFFAAGARTERFEFIPEGTSVRVGYQGVGCGGAAKFHITHASFTMLV